MKVSKIPNITTVTVLVSLLYGCASPGGIQQLGGSVNLPDGSTFTAVQATNKTEGTGGPEGSTVYAFKCEKGQKCEMVDVRFASDENANMKLVRNATNLGSSFVFGGLGQLLRRPDNSYSQTTVSGGSVGSVSSTNKALGGASAGGTGGNSASNAIGGAGGNGGKSTSSATGGNGTANTSTVLSTETSVKNAIDTNRHDNDNDHGNKGHDNDDRNHGDNDRNHHDNDDRHHGDNNSRIYEE